MNLPHSVAKKIIIIHTIIYMHVLSQWLATSLFRLSLFLKGMAIFVSVTLIELVFFLFSLNYCWLPWPLLSRGKKMPRTGGFCKSFQCKGCLMKLDFKEKMPKLMTLKSKFCRLGIFVSCHSPPFWNVWSYFFPCIIILQTWVNFGGGWIEMGHILTDWSKWSDYRDKLIFERFRNTG